MVESLRASRHVGFFGTCLTLPVEGRDLTDKWRARWTLGALVRTQGRPMTMEALTWKNLKLEIVHRDPKPSALMRGVIRQLRCLSAGTDIPSTHLISAHNYAGYGYIAAARR